MSHYGNDSLFDIPRGWSWCKLYDVCIFESGFAFKSASYRKSGVPLVRISNIQDNAIALDECVYIQESVDSRYHIQKGDLLIALSGATTGKMGVYQYSDDALLNQRVGNLRVISPNCFIPEYRNLFLSSKEDEILKKAWGGAQPNISPSTICDFDIPLPPVNEQSRIVLAVSKCMSIVDFISREGEEIEASIDKAKVKILELAIHGKLVPQNPADEPAIELLKYINPAFKPSDNLHYIDCPTGWAIATVSDIFEINPRVQAPDDADAGFVAMANICDGFDDVFSYEVRKWSSIKKGFTRFEDGDIAVAKISPCLENRKSVILRNLPNGIGAGTTELNIFRSSIVVPEYGLMFFKSDYFINSCAGSYNGVVGQQRISRSLIEEMPFLLPPIDEQRRIISAVNDYFAVLNRIEAALLEG